MRELDLQIADRVYPHMTVAAENMGFALKIQGVPKVERLGRVREAAQLLDLADYLGRKPKALSGGKRERVAMARAIVRNPQVFLMDEPLSNLDAKLRVDMRLQISSPTRRGPRLLSACGRRTSGSGPLERKGWR